MTASAASGGRGLEFRILGPLEVRRDGVALPLGGTRQRALLAVLLLHANEVVSSDQLVERLWNGSPPGHPEHAVQVFVSRLRKSVGAEALQTHAPGYRLVVEQGALDAEVFVRLLEQGRERLDAGDPESALARLDEADALWRGEPLADFLYESFAAPHVERLEELRLAGHEHRVDAGLALGDHVRLVPELEAFVAEHPLRERAYAQLMLALYRCGRQADALAVYHEARGRLTGELGIEPGPELAELNRQVLNQDSELAAVPVTRRRAGNLPRAPNPLIGRAGELASAQAMLRADDVHLLTLTGPGGTGKTRLATELAASVEDEFAAGVFFVPLASIDDPSLVARAVAQTLGVIEQPGRDTDDVLRGFLPGKRLLLVLDNFEQVVSAADLLPKLCDVSADLKIVVTSRARLRVAGEHVIDVPPLAVPDAAVDRLDVVAESEAGALFLARATAAHPDFAPGDSDAATIGEICARLDGLPLALELAAARIAMLTPAALLERLEHRLSILTRGGRDAESRQQTLRDAIAWSFDLLAEGDQRLFARLSVFAGGCSLHAAEAVCCDDGEVNGDLLDGLTSLVEKSLVRRRDDVDGEPRFWMLETIGEFAAERLVEEGGADRARERLADWCDALVRRAEHELVGPDQDAWRARLEADYANIRAALAWSVEAGSGIALSMVPRLQEYWEPRGFFREAREMLDAVLRGAPAETEPFVDALCSAAWFAFCEGDLTAADELIGRAQGLAERIRYRLGLEVSLSHRAWLAYYRDEYTSAVALGTDALEIARELELPHRAAEALALLGNVELATGAYADARRLLEESAALSREQGNLSALALRLGDIGFVERLQGDATAAAARFDESLALATELDLRPARAYALLNLAAIARETEPEVSQGLAREALALAGEMGEKSAVAQALVALAEAVAASGHALDAERLMRGALDRYIELGDRLAIIGVLEKLAVAAIRSDEVERAATLAGAAAALRDALDVRRETPEHIEVAAFRGGEDEAFERAWSRGAAMDLSEVAATIGDVQAAVDDVRS